MAPSLHVQRPIRDGRPAVLVVHGFTAQPETVAHLGPYLERAGFAHAIPRLRGHGTRYQDLVGVTWQDWYDDALLAFEALAAEYGPVGVVGHSMGALVAGLIAARRPETAALVMLAPALEFANPAVRFLPVLGSVVRTWSGQSSILDPQMRADYAHVNYTRFPVKAFAQLFALSRAVRHEFGAVRCPALVVHSRRDQVIPPAASEVALRLLGSHDKRLVWFERGGHEMFLDLERDAISEAVAAFLAEKLPVSTPSLIKENS